ncbi:uncharacterized protein LOC575388 [Strongylocentrotus purpuratus]|uniref:Uncharacterized protein n=1 Tax=Strongylocentrotus purpuratus TaxID=7668 RepID=A0A7M7RC36_STRPU|nr:uncharacterized protein LOC575388 [Strongylocentrotus purpuratus]
MNRFLVLLVVLALVLGLAAARSEPRKNKGKNKEGGRREGKGNNTSAAQMEWIWSECVPNTGSCGKGQKIGNCSGEPCEVATKTVDCRVKCAKEAVNNEAPVAVDDEEAVATVAPARGGGRPGKGRRPGKDGNGKGRENSGTGNGRRPEKPSRGGRKPNKNDKPAKAKECKYSRATLSECDLTRNQMNRTKVLKGTPTSECPEVVVESIRCDRQSIRNENRNCNYTRGEFGPCNETTNLRTREDTLTDIAQVSEECRLVRTIEHECSKPEHRGRPMRCRYNWEQAPTCNETTNQITMTGSLVVVEGAPAECEAVRTHELPCKKGKVPCTLGEWGEYSECLDGMQTRTRDLQKGPHVCQRLTKESATCE